MLDMFEITIRLLLAVICSGLIGLEREFKHKPAGLRTNILVGLGAALTTIASIQSAAFDNVDPTRIMAGIITGVGFLGAGLIIQGRDEVVGITTATTVWVVAAIGMAIGLGMYAAAGLTTVLALAILFTFGNEKLRDKIKSDKTPQQTL